MTNQPRVAVFGASGAIGAALCKWFASRDWNVAAIGRSAQSEHQHLTDAAWIRWDPVAQATVPAELSAPFNALVWAQGMNLNDSIQSFNLAEHERMYQANVTYILQSLHALLAAGLLASPTRLCIISSIWQNISRQNKLSYTVTKAALQGLVNSLTIDLGQSGHLVNAVLPGALDTPMTRANLASAQISQLENLTPLKRLSTLDDVCNLTGYLCSSNNTGITGQFIAADGGFTHARIL